MMTGEATALRNVPTKRLRIAVKKIVLSEIIEPNIDYAVHFVLPNFALSFLTSLSKTTAYFLLELWARQRKTLRR